MYNYKISTKLEILQVWIIVDVADLLDEVDKVRKRTERDSQFVWRNTERLVSRGIDVL
jgi:hypothetical protein